MIGKKGNHKRKGKLLSLVMAAALVLGTAVVPADAATKTKVTNNETTYPWTATEATGDYIADSYTGITTGHVIESLTQERLLDLLSSQGDYYIVFGGPENETSQKLLPLINAQAKKDGITKIYQFDPLIDGYQIDITDPETEFQGNAVWNTDRTAKIPHSVYELWQRIEDALPAGTFEKYESDDTLLLAYHKDSKEASVKASYLYSEDNTDADAALTAEITKVFRGGSENGAVVKGNERTDFEFFKRIYNAAATSVETAATEPTADRLAKETEIFTDDDKEGFALHQVNYTELLDVLNTPGEHYIFFGASWCHNTQAIIGSVARKAKANGIKTVYVYDTTVGNQLTFGTGAQENTVVSRSSVFNSRNSVDTTTGYNNISYLYATIANRLGTFTTENNSKQNNSIAYYPNGDLEGTATSVAPWETAADGQDKNAIRLQMPFLIGYDKSKAQPVTKQWLHKDSAGDTYTEYMLELAWVRATDEAKADTDTENYDGLTKVEFAAEAVKNLSDVLGDKEISSTDATEPSDSNSSNTSTVKKPKAPTLKKVKAGKKSATVKWSKVSGAKGYVIYRATSKKGKYKKIATVSNAKTVSYKVKKLKSKKTYYFKVKSYKLDGKKKVLSAFSKAKSVKVK